MTVLWWRANLYVDVGLLFCAIAFRAVVYARINLVPYWIWSHFVFVVLWFLIKPPFSIVKKPACQVWKIRAPVLPALSMVTLTVIKMAVNRKSDVLVFIHRCQRYQLVTTFKEAFTCNPVLKREIGWPWKVVMPSPLPYVFLSQSHPLKLWRLRPFP